MAPGALKCPGQLANTEHRNPMPVSAAAGESGQPLNCVPGRRRRDDIGCCQRRYQCHAQSSQESRRPVDCLVPRHLGLRLFFDVGSKFAAPTELRGDRLRESRQPRILATGPPGTSKETLDAADRTDKIEKNQKCPPMPLFASGYLTRVALRSRETMAVSESGGYSRGLAKGESHGRETKQAGRQHHLTRVPFSGLVRSSK